MVTQNKLPEFRGKALIEVPRNIPQADFLKDDFGKAVFEEYQGRAGQDYKGIKALGVLSYSDGVVTGSNAFSAVLLNQILRPEGLRTANPADLENILRSGALDLKGTYEDSALVLRSEDGPEQYLARSLNAQLKERLGKKLKLPVMIPYAGLDLTKDDQSKYGLQFRLREDAEVIYAPILNQKSGQNFSSEDIDVKTGLPAKLGKGNRTLYTRPTGLSRLLLDRDLDLDSGWDDDGLSSSGGYGRVVVVGGSGEAASQNLGKYTAQLKAAKEEYHAKLSALQTSIDAELKSK